MGYGDHGLGPFLQGEPGEMGHPEFRGHVLDQCPGTAMELPAAMAGTMLE